MTEAVLQIEDDYLMGNLAVEKTGQDPRLIRFGYNPAIRGISIDPRRSGVRAEYIPVGVFFPINTFQTVKEIFTMDEYKDREEIVDVLAADAEAVVRAALEAWGYQSLFYDVTDVGLVRVVNKTLLPTLSEIREICTYEEDGKTVSVSPIPAVCPGSDEHDLGSPRDLCASCHLKWLKSEACQAYMEEIAQNGMSVKVGSEKIRVVKPALAVLDAARRIVITGLETYLKKASEDWGQIISELDNKVRNKLNEPEQFLRKDLHQPKPQNKELEVATRLAESQSEASGKVIEQLAANQQQMAQMMMQSMQQQQQFMQMLMQKDSAGGKPKADKPAKAENS